MEHFDNFDTQMQIEEFPDPNEDYGWDDNDENLIDGFIDDGMGHEYDDGSDRDNWEDEQVFQDNKF